MKVAIVVVAAVAAGFFFGRWSVPSSANPRETGARVGAAADDDDDDNDGFDAAGAIDPALASVGPGASSSPAGSSSGGFVPTVVNNAARVEQLEAEVRRLTALAGQHSDFQQQVEGKPVPFPEGRTAAADQQQMLDVLQQSLKRRGLDGEVTAMDCGEYPCIAHGVVRGDVDGSVIDGVVKDARASVGGAPYASVSRFNNDEDPSLTKTSFSLALFSEDLPTVEQDNLNKRLRARKNAYADAHQ